MTVKIGGVVRGLIDASGTGGGSVGGINWDLIFHLTAWKQDGAITRGKLRCEMPVSSKEALDELTALIDAYDVVDFEVAKITEWGAAILKYVTPSQQSDIDLFAIREELQIPFQIDTPEFGTLKLDRRFDWYEGKALWCGQEISIILSCGDYTNPEHVIFLATSLFQNQKEWSFRVKEFAANQLLALKNEVWLNDNEAELSRLDFISKMTLNEISIDDEGNFTFWHNDGDMFWGHAIQISGNLSDGCTDADIPG